MSLEALIDDFEKVENDVFSYIDEEDKKAIEQIEQEWLFAKNHFEGVKKELLSLQEKFGKVEGSSLVPRHRDELCLELNADFRFRFRRDYTVEHRFNFDHGIAHAHNGKLAAFGSFQRRVYCHFQEKYHLSGMDQSFVIENEETERSLQDIVSAILELNNHISFKRAGEMKLIEDFKRDFGEEVKLSKNKVSFSDCFSMCYYTPENIDDSMVMDRLALGLSFFEQGALSVLNFILNSLPGYRNVVFSDTFNFDEDLCDKLSSVKLFKNGRIDIKFKSQEAAVDFVNLFKLTTK